MRHFGAFLSSLRSGAALSQQELAILVDTSRSTVSRLENDEISQPFKGSARKIVLALAEVLCTSKKETELYLELAGIDRSLLTENEKIQLGFMHHIVQGSPEEKADLERFERLYEQRLRHLEAREALLGITDSPPNLKLRIQEYTNISREIQKQLGKLYNREVLPEPSVAQTVQVHYASVSGGRAVVGYQYGEERDMFPTTGGLYKLASPNARYLMQLAGVKRFAVDDCIMLANSDDFEGWETQDIKTTILTAPLPIPDDLERLKQEKLSIIEKHYFNQQHYRLVSASPAFSELDHLKITLAPLGFYDYYPLNLFFDEPLLTALDGSKVSIRQKYGNTALTYSSTDRGTSLIPAPVSVQPLLVTRDQQIVLVERSFSVAFYPGHWSASFEETMNASMLDRRGKTVQAGDANFFATAIRGLNEEFAIPASAVESIKVLSLNVEYLTLSVDVIVIIKIGISSEEVDENWTLKARYKQEASNMRFLSTDLNTVVDKLFSKTLWHPTARMRLLQFLFHTYGIDTVKEAMKELKDS